MPSISFLDSTGFATLTNGKSVPRVNAWTPRRVPVGPKATGLGTGRIHMFEFRTDDLVQFSLDNIPGTDANMQIMLRLQAHLLRGGLVTLAAGRTAYASHWGTCSLAPDTEPEIQFSDRDALEYSFVATLRTSGAGASDFYPPLIPGLMLWLMGDTLVADLDDAALVPQWTDISGEDNHAVQANTLRMPTFRTGILNEHAVVEFGSDNYVLTDGILVPTAGSTIFVVQRRNGAWVSNGAFFCWGQPGAGTGDEGSSVQEYPVGTLGFYVATGAPDGVAPLETAPSDPTDWHIVTLRFDDPSTCVPYVDAVAGTSFNPNSDIEGSNWSAFCAGASNGGVFGANCQIAEVLWYDSALSEANRNSVHAYLSSRYAITLP